MIATQKPLHELTAADLMSRGVVVIPEENVAPRRGGPAPAVPNQRRTGRRS